MPFTSLRGHEGELPLIQLEEVDAENFTVLRGFRYIDEKAGVRITIRAGEPTDLASIPFFLRWFVGTYGKHTRAAIMHDHMWRKPMDGVERRAPDGQWQADTSGIGKIEANRLFRDAMADVPAALVVLPVKRWVMWSAVTLDTLRTRMPDGPLIYLFIALHLALDVLLVVTAFGADWFGMHGRHLFGQPFPVAALLLPAVLAMLWPRRLGAGLIATYALEVLILPIFLTVVALGVLFVVSLAFAAVQRTRKMFGADLGLIYRPSITSVESAVLALPSRSIGGHHP